MAQWIVRADYDPKDGVWYVVDSDIPGLTVDGDSIAALATKAGAHLPDLLEIHQDDLPQAQLSGPHSIRIIAHHEQQFDIAA